MSGLADAIILATDAHRGQLDKAGEPYIFHPLRVMMAMRFHEDRIAAVLHDVVEDTDVTIADLVKMDFPTQSIDAVEALTHAKGEPYMDYIHRVALNYIATRVKLADLADNMDLERLPELTLKDLERYHKYRQARAYLKRGNLR